MAKQSDKLAAVRMDRPGVVACGPYRAGQVYEVGDDLSESEARRLVNVKGFTPLYASDLKGGDKPASKSSAPDESTGQAADKAED